MNTVMIDGKDQNFVIDVIYTANIESRITKLLV
jgi:hypothetical protein